MYIRTLILTLLLSLYGCSHSLKFPFQGMNTRYCGHSVLVSSIYLRTNRIIPLYKLTNKYPAYLSGNEIITTYKELTNITLNKYLPYEIKNYNKGDIILLNYKPLLHWYTVIKINKNTITIHDPSIFGGVYNKPKEWFNHTNVLLIIR